MRTMMRHPKDVHKVTHKLKKFFVSSLSYTAPTALVYYASH